MGYIIKQRNGDLEVWRWANFFTVWSLRRLFNDVGEQREADSRVHAYLGEMWALVSPFYSMPILKTLFWLHAV